MIKKKLKKIIHVIFYLLGFNDDILYLKKLTNNHSKDVQYFNNILLRNRFIKYYDIFDQDVNLKNEDYYMSHWKDLPFDIIC